ncbi:MAG: hypothetical protein WBA29_09690, partial [Xanthobacteraceae bacterium]
MKILRAAAMLVMLSGPAYAQMPDVNILPQERQKTPEELERDRQLDKAYRDSLRKIPDAKAVNDPWGSVRGAETPAATPRAKPR